MKLLMALVLVTLPIAGCTASSAPAPEPSRKVIHVADWHYVPREAFIADLRDQDSSYTDAELDQAYDEHLADVERVQEEQLPILRKLIAEHGLTRIWVEGLTPEDMADFRELVKQVKAIEELDVPRLREQLKEATEFVATLEAGGSDSKVIERAKEIQSRFQRLLDEQRENTLAIGAAGKLFMAGELTEIVPLDDEETHGAANPVGQDGAVAVNEGQIEAREQAMAKRLLASEEPVEVIVLGVAHNLGEQFENTGAEYQRVMPAAVQQLYDD